MKVFKFGGASVKDADAIRNVAKIIDSYSSEQLFIVVSAMASSKSLDVYLSMTCTPVFYPAFLNNA